MVLILQSVNYMFVIRQGGCQNIRLATVLTVPVRLRSEEHIRSVSNNNNFRYTQIYIYI